MKFSDKIIISDYFGESESFDTTNSLLEFLNRQIEGWKAVDQKNKTKNGLFVASWNKIEGVVEGIKGVLTAEFEGNKEERIRDLVNKSGVFNESFLNIDTKKGVEFIELLMSDKMTDAIWNRFCTRLKKPDLRSSLEDPSIFKAELLAHDYTSDFKNDDNVDKKLFSALLNQYRDSIKSVHDERSLEESEYKKVISDYKELSGVTHDKYVNSLESNNKAFDSQLNDWKGRISSLESTYEKLLRLKKPAEYWKASAERYQGNVKFASILLATAVIASVSLLTIFFGKWLSGDQTALSLGSFQGAIIFGVLVAVLAFVLKILSRIIFSSLHLARDSEEREQLTYFYLSLENEGKLPDADRQLIFTALFSRTETGLLTNEHGPTLPVSDLIKATRTGS